MKKLMKNFKQVNSVETIEIPRSVRDRAFESSQVAFADASGIASGVVIYLLNMVNQKSLFLICKTKMLDSSLLRHSIPTYECVALRLGV